MRLAKNITLSMLSRSVSAGLFGAPALAPDQETGIKCAGDLQATREENSGSLGISCKADSSDRAEGCSPCTTRCLGAVSAFLRPIRNF